MAQLEIEQQRAKWMPKIPHKVMINGQLVGIMQEDRVRIEMPRGRYEIRIESMIKWFSSGMVVEVKEGLRNVMSFGDREGVWDGLFWVALVMEVVHMFITLPLGWNIAYHVVDEGLFVGWIVYELSIRKRYFKMNFDHRVAKKDVE